MKLTNCNFFSILLIGCISLLFITSFHSKAFIQSNGSVGDVKYSVLPPDQFMKLNPGWIPLDGGFLPGSDSIFKKSALRLNYSFSTLPDARGVFIRGMNDRRETAKGDADGDRQVGIYQADKIKKHTHNLNQTQHNIASIHINDRANLGTARPLPGSHTLTIQVLNTGDNLDGEETRPRNIALFIYVKVN